MAKKHSLMRCRECGFPRLVSFFIKWQDNGTITQMMRKDFRVVLLHHGFLDNLFSNIEAKLGISIEHIAFEAQRNASKETFQAFTRIVPGAMFFTKLGFVRRIAVELFNRVGILTGMCDSKTLEYKSGVLGVARIRNPFNARLMAANVVGAFETLENVPFDYEIQDQTADSFVIKVWPTGQKPEIAERMKLDHPPMLPGNIGYKRCSRCKTPLPVASRLKWIDNEGIILDTRTGSRVIMLDGYMATTVFREMVSELGDDVNELIVDAQREWTIDHVGQLGLIDATGQASAEDLGHAYREYLESMSLYGMGNLAGFSAEDESMSFVIENPYELHILAGTLQGLREALEKTASSVQWKELGAQSVEYTVAPHLPGTSAEQPSA